MKRVSLLSALLLAATAMSAAAAPQPPKVGYYTQADLQRAQLEAAAQPLGPPEQFEITAGQMDGYDALTGAHLTPQSLSRSPDPDHVLLADDNDTAHYMRGRSLAIHIFINHTGGTFTAQQRADAGARAHVAKDHYLANTPGGANVSFDWQGSDNYWFYEVTVGYNIPNSGMSQAIAEDALAILGFADSDGDGTRVDDFTLYLQTFDRGFDNVLGCFQPAVTGRAFASYGLSETWLYTDSNANVWAHEWGHLYGACDEYIEGGQCNGGINCNLCQSWYLDENVNNGNCQLAACAPHETCLMINNTFTNICSFTLEHWGWVDEGGAGLLDTVKRRTSGNNFVTMYELYHNGWFFWDNTTQSEMVSQRWTNWAAVGIRPGAGADEDITLYGDNNHNYIHASSVFGGSAVDFVVGDYNHSPPSNEHIQLTHFAGPVLGYNLTFEGGTEVLYPDGIVRAGSWQDYNIVRVWDVPLFGGEEISFILDNQTAGLDLSMALYKSNGGAYWVGRSGAVITANVNGNGLDESFTYTVPEDDVYGLVIWSNNAVAGNFTIQIGSPDPFTLAEETPFSSPFALRLFNYIPTTNYWALVGNRPDVGTDMDLSLFTDVNYINQAAESNYSGNQLDFIAVDYNHASITQDYLRVWRTAGAGNHRTEWEQDPETGLGYVADTHVAPHLGKVWDVFLTGGENYFFRQYHQFAPLTMDNGLYLFSSADGDYYKERGAFAAASNFRLPADGGEWFNFIPPISDWYGLINIVNDETGQAYGILSGPDIALAEDGQITRGEQIVFGSNNVGNIYWTVFGARPSPGDNVYAQLYGDDAYTISTLVASDFGGGAVSYVVGDYNHSPLGTVYPRFWRDTGFGAVDIEWEGGADGLGFVVGGITTTNLVWPAGDVVEAYDILVPAARTIRIVVDDLSGVMDLGIELFDSNGATYYSRRGLGVASSDATGVGGSEVLSFANPSDDWLGLIIYNKNDLGGNYRVRVGDQVLVGVDDGPPATFSLRAGRNPSSGDAPLNFSLEREGEAQLAIFDLQGRKLRSVAEGRYSSGSHKATWDGRDDAGNMLSAGVYMARLQSGGKVETVKLVRSR